MEIAILLEKGGSMEFERTGIFPSYIRIYVKQHQRTWRLKLRAKKQNGVLKLKGNPIYEYEFAKHTCKIRTIEKDSGVGNWVTIKDIMPLLLD